MSTKPGDPVKLADVRRMLEAWPPPTVKLGIALNGGRYAEIVSTPIGRSGPQEKLFVQAVNLADLFHTLATAVK